jgi:energy-coupling factor transport system permease protein
MSLVPTYRRRASALHAARAGIAAPYCAAFALVGMLHDHPLVLTGALGGIALAGSAAGVGVELWRSARIALPLVLLIALVNPLVYQEGQTLLVRGGELLGRRFDVTLEALTYGAIGGLRLVVIALAFGLYSAAVDPDEMLKLMRRRSYRSALTASLATRLVPVLARDATRMGDAARCLPHPPGRASVARAALARALDRAVDVAAALEVRGYASARTPRRERRPWSRHDLRLAAAAAALAVLAVAGRALGAGDLDPYPTLDVALGAPELVVASAIAACGAAPFAGAAARMGVARA